jgi:predicted nucleic acid-binding Zn ribbon protein
VDHHLAFDDPLPACKCGGGLAKVFQLAGVKFKGDGFYRTDNQVNKPKED